MEIALYSRHNQTHTVVLGIGGTLLSAVLLAWVLRSFDLGGVGQVLAGADAWPISLVGLLMVMNYVVRALRWRTLFAGESIPRRSTLFLSMMIGYLANSLLPARAGELVRAYVLGLREGVAKVSVLGTIVVERVADLVVALLLLATVLAFIPVPGWLRRTGIAVSAIAFFAVVILALLGLRGPRMVAWVVSRLRFLPVRLVKRIDDAGRGFVHGLLGLREKWRFPQFMGLTASIWALELGTVALLAKALRVPVDLKGSLLTMLVTGLGTMVPSSPGYVGTYEFFGVNALRVVGVTGEVALGFVILLHAATLIGASLIGAICLAVHSLTRQPAGNGRE